ncbi:hypothetical protein RHOSPDRAFT_36239 [Rhodotorula sp. JG-1b]|nr:hypothetical protein RHOSPDRAFT_36239 [Rhodotorula sp. JG-1b]
MAKKKRPNAQGKSKAAKDKAQPAADKSIPTPLDKQSAAASTSQATPATKQPEVKLPPPRAPAPPETAEQSPEVKSLRAAIEASLNFLEHGFAAEAFGALQSALKPGAPELDPDRYMRVGEVSTLIADAHKLITTADGDPTLGLEKLAEAEKLWPDKDSPYAATPKTQAAADRFKLEAYWRTKDFPQVYELSCALIKAGDRRIHKLALRMVVCYEVDQLDKAAEAAKLYLASAAESDPLAAERRPMADRIVQLIREKKIGDEAFQQGKWDRAITFYVKALHLALDVELGGAKVIASVYYNLGMAQLKADHLDAAVDYFSLALDDDPTHVKALRNRAIAYEQLDQLEFAIDDLRDAVRAAKDGKDAAFQAALQHDLDRVQDKYEDAQENFEPDYDDDDDDYYHYHYHDEDDYDDDEDGSGHPYTCGCHGYTAEEYARFFSDTMKRGRSVNKDQHYRTLGITPGASETEVRTAFKALARLHHPDKGGDEEKFKEIRHAYGELTGEGNAVPECVVA